MQGKCVYAAVLAQGVSVPKLGFRHWNRDQFTADNNSQARQNSYQESQCRYDTA